MRREIQPGDRVCYASSYTTTLPKHSILRKAVGTVREISAVGITHYALIDWETPGQPEEHSLANVVTRNLRRV